MAEGTFLRLKVSGSFGLLELTHGGVGEPSPMAAGGAPVQRLTLGGGASRTQGWVCLRFLLKGPE